MPSTTVALLLADIALSRSDNPNPTANKMMKMIAVVFACLVAASSAQLLTSLGSTTWQHESTAQQHSPWAASASTRSQVHGPDATLLAAAPVVAHAPLLAAAPVAYAAGPYVHAAHALPIAFLRR